MNLSAWKFYNRIIFSNVLRKLCTSRRNEKFLKANDKAYESYENMAKVYDPITKVTTFSYVDKWRDYMISRLQIKNNIKLIDAAGGQGATSMKFINKIQNCQLEVDYHVTVCDISQSMMDLGKTKYEKLEYDFNLISWVVGDAQNLPFPKESFDVYTNSFGLRSVDLHKVIKEAYRVLKPGGQFLLLDFNNSPNAIIRWLYYRYLLNVVPTICDLMWNEREALLYLAATLKEIPNNEEFVQIIKTSGFERVSYKNLSFGIASCYEGFKL